MQIHDLFVPLTPKEHDSVRLSVIRLYDNPDFQLLIRDLFSKANPISPSFLDVHRNDAIAAAKKDGEKNLTRYLFNYFINKDKPETERPTTQDEFDFIKI